MAQGKRYKQAMTSVDRDKTYSLDEAVKMVKANAKAKFDETIEIAMNLGIDPRHADQAVRGMVELPSGTGKTVRVAVFARGAKAEEAKAAGADLVGAEDLAGDRRWPKFSEAAVARKVRAVLASPLPYNQDAVGVVAVLSEQQRPWSAEGELALLAFTDLAALFIASMMQGEQQSELAAQLQGALNSRQVIEQAKGVLIGRQGISARAAYEQLRAQARSERRKLAAVCAEVVADAEHPAGDLPPS